MPHEEGVCKTGTAVYLQDFIEKTVGRRSVQAVPQIYFLNRYSESLKFFSLGHLVGQVSD